MSTFPHRLHVRQIGIALTVASVALLGCARKVQIEVPAGFHGHVRIACTGLTDDRTTTLRVDTTGNTTSATCPMRQTSAVVTQAGAAIPLDAPIMWTTTGDGYVREITLDIR